VAAEQYELVEVDLEKCLDVTPELRRRIGEVITDVIKNEVLKEYRKRNEQD
jgi:hypothetical protein